MTATAAPSECTPKPIAKVVWIIAGILLLSWNGWLAWHANPYTLLHYYDDVQYQLLARNRLAGHREVGEAAQTVGQEGAHPMWRPGLVWLTESLARLLGSVQAGAAAASALGTTLLELAVLWLAWRCFGRLAWGIAGGLMFVPLTANAWFFRMAIGQGPEPWAAAMLLWGLAGLAQARQLLPQGRWFWPGAYALLGGALAGLADWFRTGNLLLFLAPCGVYALVCWRARDGRGLAVIALALAGFFSTSYVGGSLTPSRVSKAVVNLRHNLTEAAGPLVEFSYPDGGTGYTAVGGLEIVPGTAETFADHIVRTTQGQNPVEFIQANLETLLNLYLERLGQIGLSMFGGWRQMIGNLVFAAFCLGVMAGLCRRGQGPGDALAFAAAALIQILGPITLLVGDSVSVYLLVPLPLWLLVAAYGIGWLADLIRIKLAGFPFMMNILVAFIGVAGLGWTTVRFHTESLAALSNLKDKADIDQADLDALGLQGQVVCRSMAWFVDRPVEPIMLPWAKVAELGQYARERLAGGILVHTQDAAIHVWTNPYGSLAAFQQALQECHQFNKPRTSGVWCWYPVKGPVIAKAVQ